MLEDLNADLNDREDLIRATETIIQLYTDKAHFVYELLQNAEDCKADMISFAMFSDRLEVLHNGEPFTQANLTSLRSVANTTKRDEANAIGKFGVGFKSVFGICKTIKLYSAPKNYNCNGDYLPEFAYTIENFRELKKISDSDNTVEVPKEYTTKYVFQYCVSEDFSGYKTTRELIQKLSERLKGLGTAVLLFMKNIKAISYTIDCDNAEFDGKGMYMLEKTEKTEIKKTEVKPGSSCFKVVAIGENRVDDVSYLMYTKPTKYGKDVNIAFACEWGRDDIPTFSAAPEKHICVYFPTDTESKVKFVVQAPFGTTPNRGGIPETEENNDLSLELSHLLKSAILDIRDRGWLTLELLNILPFDNRMEYGRLNALHNMVLTIMENDRILPTITGKYATRNLARIVRGAKIADLFPGEKLEGLVKIVGAEWLPVTLTESSKMFSELHAILIKQLSVEEIDSDNLPTLLRENEQFWKLVDDDWLRSFYSYLLEEQRSMLGKSGDFALVPIIKTTADTFLPAYTYERSERIRKPNIFRLPQNARRKAGQLNFVSNFLSEHCSDFLNAMDIGEPDGYDYLIEELTSQYDDDSDLSEDVELSQVKRAIKYLKEDCHDNAIQEFKDKLRLRYVIPNDEDVYITTCAETQLYGVNDSYGFPLEEYFAGMDCNVGILYEDFYLDNGIKSSDVEILKRNIAKHTIVELGDDNWNDGAKCWNSGDFKRFLTFDYLEDVIDAILKGDKSKSALLFSALKQVELHLRGEYIQGLRRQDIFPGESTIVEELKNCEWLWHENGNRVYAHEITRNELDVAIYGEVDNSSQIYEILGFKEDPIDAYINGLKNLSTEQRMLIIQQIAPLQEDDDIYDPTITDDGGEPPTEEIGDIKRSAQKTVEAYCNAQSVEYKTVTRSIRVSNGDERAHIKHRYNGFCQICSCKSSYWETPELFLEPKKELEQMYLSLCCNCAAEYRRYRNDDSVMETFKQSLIDAVQGSNEINLTDDRRIYFTQKHLFEIQTILKEMGKK